MLSELLIIILRKNEKNNKKMTLFDGNQCLNKYTETFYVDL